jgi:hypothetical protein
VSAKGTAVVVDGRRLLMTPLRHALVPPPMCAAAAELPAPAVALALGDAGSCEALAALMSDGRLALLRSVEEDLWEETLEVGRQPGWTQPGCRGSGTPPAVGWHCGGGQQRRPGDVALAGSCC